MGSQDKKWIIRDQSGHIYGPFTITKLGELITKGILTGEEEVAAYPAGDWAPLSSEKKLYDLVLLSLSQSRPKKNATRIQPTTQRFADQRIPEKVEVPPLPKAEIKSKKIDPEQEKKKIESDPFYNEAINPAPPLAFNSSPYPKQDLELSDRESLVKRKGSFIPIIFLLLAFILFFFALFSNKKIVPSRQPISLIAPHIKKVQNASRSKELTAQGWAYFLKDTFNNYVRAEELFVNAIEESPTNSDALVMLLYTDFQLWPYAKQDGADQNAIQGVLQLLSKADLYGPARALGQATVDVTLGRDISARSQITSSLIAQPSDGRLYVLKAQMFLQNSDYNQAIAYFDKAETLMPRWDYPIYMLGNCYARLGNLGAANKYFTYALQMNPNHANARLELGILESKYFGHDDVGSEFITLALESGERFIPSAEARARYTLALIYNKRGHRSLAKQEAEESLRLNSTDPDVREFLSRLGVSNFNEGGGDDQQHSNLGDQYMRAENYLGAQAQYKAAFQANKKNARAAMKAAQALWKLHQSSDAIHYLELSIEADRKLIPSYVLLADYKSQRYDFDAAVRALETAIKVDPKNYEIYRGYAELFLRRADPSTAELYANRALQLYETDVKLNEIMSRIQLAKKNMVKAMQYGKRAIELDKSNVSAQVNYGKMKASYEGVKEAAEYMKELIDTYPNQLAYRVGFADILIQDEQYSAAAQVLNQVVSADDMNKDAYFSLGEANFLSGSLDEALGNFLSAARVDPSDPSGLFRAGEIYLKSNKPNEAQRQFQLVLRISPLFPRAHFNLARAYQNLGLGDLSLKELEEEKKLNPKLADPYEFSGDLYMASRKYAQAAGEYQKVSAIKPQNGPIYVKLAKAYRGQGSTDAALSMLRLAAAKESGLSEIYLEYGLVYESKGMAEQAITSFKQYLRLEPNATDRDEILGKIKQLE